MKNFSNVMNVVLLLAVCVLFYLYFSLKPAAAGTEKNNSGDKNTGLTDKIDPSKLPDGKIAFINVDSITLGYEYIKDETKTLSAKQQALESQYQSMTMKFQQEYQQLQESAQAGIAPRAELEKKQQELQIKQQEILQKENQMKALELEVAKRQEEMMKTVNEFIIRFNKQYNYDFILSKSAMINTIAFASDKYDVTAPVLKGLNEEYRAKKEAQKKP